ncbi:hypothetical protein AQUCO_00500372v1 [Aquilegia coerulea]|uniref:HMA domain-containing protein n=1 Tax=Aquilegia coerulea TaxID=218851 RepID=A0A2G5ERN6_AQUCA|nr:hypothetical protein AQUCO_00500372v1 [Aquilegia coerulea]PIA58402.1 hypothetical protein AQUCO_00500372v1 [Aquilegia coerulea]
MHCEACARKVERSLRRFEGVEDVKTDYKAHMVVVKGKTADPIKVCERIQKKSGRKVEIISPLPKPPEEKKEEQVAEKKEEKKDEPPPVITVVLLISMHCEACAQVIQKRIRKIDGVESVETNLANHQVTVKGVLDPEKLVESVYKKTGKQAYIVPQEEEKKEEEKKEEEKKEEVKKEEAAAEGEKKEGDDENKTEIKKSEYWPPKYYVEYAYAPQIFSDENPNACSVM